jgi:hypothetical protein
LVVNVLVVSVLLASVVMRDSPCAASMSRLSLIVR